MKRDRKKECVQQEVMSAIHSSQSVSQSVSQSSTSLFYVKDNMGATHEEKEHTKKEGVQQEVRSATRSKLRMMANSVFWPCSYLGV